MPDKYAYRADAVLTEAFRAHNRACEDFQRDVINPWDEVNPHAITLWRRSLHMDITFAGFRDPGGQVPAGLSRRQGREELIPKRGSDGEPYRRAWEQMSKRPKLSAVFRFHGIDPVISRTDHSRWYTPGTLLGPDAVYVTWSVEYDDPGEHLTRIPLSEYYAVREAIEATVTAAEGG